ncbi:MAG: valine--tRNA ligase [Bacilli bacterium]|nr:valine--tRNA ligase [Bacilli bacterium]
MEKKYDHRLVEYGKYDYWLKNDLFKSGDLNKKPFSIVIPPPNVTGKLHLGHAWDTSLPDIIARYKRLKGYDVLWLPGMDHAGVATQAKIDARLKEQGINPKSIGRDKWMEYAWSYKEEYANIIRKQWSNLGLSLDYSKERFTLDEGSSNAVNKVFIDLYNKGYIYRGTKPINWDPIAKTALSNIEVIYKKTKGNMYYFKYMFPNSDQYIEVATTRPETMASDKAVVVNPKDDRYKNIVGKSVISPLRKELIPVITDEYIDISFGTGAMKCSAHAIDDFDILKKNNIEIVESIDTNGILNDYALEFSGLTREEARIKIVEKLNKEGLITKIEDYNHEVGYSERTDAVIEIMIMPQWFVKMDGLSKALLDVQSDKEKKVKFVTSRFEKILINWMISIQDWCISRQVWWGHRIPAWYKDDQVKVQIESPGLEWTQDEDVLDTWFSSALWPFSTLGFPNTTNDLERYFPIDIIAPGYDIIFFWVARMMFQSIEFMNNIPFKEVLIHGLVRDKNGKKMSKSLGNGIDPMDVIEKYGADSLRYFITTNTAQGMDLRYDEEKIKSTWNFINKIWNASRYVEMNLNNESELSVIDKWILFKFNNKVKSITKNMDKYDFQNVGSELYEFIWNDFCDWYIELSKVHLNSKVLKYILFSILKMLHPFMPFVTEDIYMNFENKSIMLEEYPKYDKELNYKNEYKLIEDLKEYIIKVRNIKLEYNITKDALIEYTCKDEFVLKILNKLLKLDDYNNYNDENMNKISIISDNKDITINYYINENIIDDTKEIEELKFSIERRKKLLSNEGYVNKAPKNIVEEERLKLEEELIKLNNLEAK